MRPIRTLALAVAALIACGAAAPGPADDPEATIVEELVVQAVAPGPAWWRVKDGDSIVYILGAPESPMPPGVTWDRSVVERRLTGANAL